MSGNALEASRVLMGDSLGFHIILVMFGLTLPILVSFFELMAIRRKDENLRNLAHQWSKIMTVLAISGVISGTIIAFQMTLVWPGILKFGGEVIGLPFMFETYAFLIEAVFLALYMATWNNKRVPAMLHWVFGLFVWLGATMTAYAITSVNAWMNMPTGFDFINGKIQNVDVVRAMFSQTALIEFAHSMPGYYLAASLAIASLYFIKILRKPKYERTGNSSKMDWYIIKVLMVLAALSFVAVAITGDLTGKYLAKHEPIKLATIEAVQKTTDHAPLILGGSNHVGGKLTGPYIKVPDALSILAGGSNKTVVKGLENVPASLQPPAYIHSLFDIKMLAVGAIATLIVGYFVTQRFWKGLRANKIVLLLAAVAGFLGIIVVELGWMITEIGRQPWAVRGYVTTAQALTTSHTVGSYAYIFPLSFVVLFYFTFLALRRVVRSGADGEGYLK